MSKLDVALAVNADLLQVILQTAGLNIKKKIISPAGLVTVTFNRPEIFVLALILITKNFK